MEHLATAIGMDPLEFRLNNMIETSLGEPNPLPGSIIPQLITSSEYEERKLKVEEFNAVSFLLKHV
jgi:xanthine dehydrogenase molybdopterin-binding subunit B